MAKPVRNVIILCLGAAMFFVSLMVVDRRFLVRLRNEKRVSDLSSIRQAISSYLTYNQSFPGTDEINFGREWKAPEVAYMDKVPQDPKLFAVNPYCYNNFGNIYLLCAQMEEFSDACQSLRGDGSCNTCTLNSGKSVSYNYCLYGSF